MIENRGSHGAVGVGGKLYVLGGGGFRSNLATCEMYDSTTSKWSAITPMETYRHALAITYMPENDSIYAVGGWINGSVCSADVERFDLVSGLWSKSASMKVARRLLGASCHRGLLYSFGGNCENNDDTEKKWFSAAVECYNPATDSWTSKADLPYPGPCSAVTVGEYIFVLLHGKCVLRYCPNSDAYTTLAALPLPDWFCFYASPYGSTIYVNGGASKGVWSRAFYSYDTLTDSWTELPQMLKQRRRCAAAIVAHKDP
jgi:N-acetylneuraminic acid mutarotase